MTEGAMAIGSETIGRLNRECQGIPLSDERAAELPIELGQLHAAVEAARAGSRLRPAAQPRSSRCCTRREPAGDGTQCGLLIQALARDAGEGGTGSADEIAALSLCEAPPARELPRRGAAVWDSTLNSISAIFNQLPCLGV